MSAANSSRIVDARRGLRTSSLEQFGHRDWNHREHEAQNVHSRLQM
jgi:hypothetical protein